jgi:hypothetical protein
MLGGASQGYLRFYGNVGGSWTENVVSNLRFESATEQAPAYATAGLGFDTWNGSGTLVKRGDGALAVVSTNASHVAVRVEEGGLLLAKELVNDHRDTGRGGFIFSDPSGIVGEKGGFVVGEHKNKRMGVSELSNKVYEAFPGFKLKDSGYSQISKLVASIDGMSVESGRNNRKYAVVLTDE